MATNLGKATGATKTAVYADIVKMVNYVKTTPNEKTGETYNGFNTITPHKWWQYELDKHSLSSTDLQAIMASLIAEGKIAQVKVKIGYLVFLAKDYDANYKKSGKASPLASILG